MIPTATTTWLVVVSILISIVSSYVAFSFADRLAQATGNVYTPWLAGGPLSMGFGNWSMHFVGMLAVCVPMDVAYDVPTVLTSLLLATLASAAAFVVVSKDRPSATQIGCGSVLRPLASAACTL